MWPTAASSLKESNPSLKPRQCDQLSENRAPLHSTELHTLNSGDIEFRALRMQITTTSSSLKSCIHVLKSLLATAIRAQAVIGNHRLLLSASRTHSKCTTESAYTEFTWPRILQKDDIYCGSRLLEEAISSRASKILKRRQVASMSWTFPWVTLCFCRWRTSSVRETWYGLSWMDASVWQIHLRSNLA